MQIQVLDLDGSLTQQRLLLESHHPRLLDLRSWGPRIRIACCHSAYRAFEEFIPSASTPGNAGPIVTLFGSGDFHHVTLALLRRLKHPFNLLVLDKHPDWMRGIPFMHCGTWLYHAARLPLVRTVFHVGGDLDFDNSYRWLAPWQLIRSGRIVVLPAIRQFQRGSWKRVTNEQVRPGKTAPAGEERIQQLLEPHRAELQRWPLYISVDKDVLVREDAAVNWDSGYLSLVEVTRIVRAFLSAADGQLAGADILGDWSPVEVDGWFRKLFHLTEHPSLQIDPEYATEHNQRANLALIDTIIESTRMSRAA